MESISHPKPFLGIRFALVGFNSIDESKLQSKLVSGGGIDVGRFNQNYSHLIVDKLIYDDPACVAARNSGKIVVLGSWVDHSFDSGILVDANSVLYRPLKDLNGIPGAKSFIVCLTGYQRRDRDDIMAMVALMGGQFSKPLVANKVTHLICYKFEGEKYELAKRMKKIKIVNHRWLEDCLKAWRLLPETDYETSGYELEMMEASAKDSEDEAEDGSTKRANKSPLGLRVSVAVDGNRPIPVEISVPVLQTKSGAQVNSSADVVHPLEHDCGRRSAFHDAFADPFDKKPEPIEVKDGLTSISKNTEKFSPMASLQHDCPKTSTFQDASSDATTNPLDKTPESREVKGGMTSISRSIERFSSLATKFSFLTYSRKRGKRSPGTNPQGDESGIQNGSLTSNNGGLKAVLASNISASKSDAAAEGTSVLEDPCKLDKLHEKKSSQILLPHTNSEKLGCGNEASFVLPARFLAPELELTSSEQNDNSVLSISGPTEGGEVAHKLSASDSTTKSFSSNVIDRKDSIQTLETLTSEGAIAETVAKKTSGRSSSQLGTEKFSTVSGSNELESKEKLDTGLPKKKNTLRKTLGTRPKVKSSSNQKGSIYLSKAVLSITRTSGEPNPPEEKVFRVFDTSVNQDMLVETEVRCRADAEVNDCSKEDAPDDTTELVTDGNESKFGKEASGEKINLENVKKRDLHSADIGKASIKKTKKSRKENNVRGNDSEVKDKGDNTLEEKENVPVNKKSRKNGGDESSSVRKPFARKETAKSDKALTKTDKKSRRISSTSMAMVSRKVLHERGKESACFIVSGLRFQKKEYQQIIRRLKGRVCRDSHQWSYQATHFVTPEIRRTEKFFAATASGSWILKGDYLPACCQAGKFLPEEPFEWHDTGLSQDGAMSLEAPRKWRLVREKTGHGAFYGMRIVIYGDCIIPSLDTIKRAVKAGDGTILATAPPYKRFLNSDTDFAVISPGMPRVDAWIQEFMNHEIPCVLADYLVEYVCKPGYCLDKHVLYNTNAWVERSFNKLQRSTEEVVEVDVASR